MAEMLNDLYRRGRNLKNAVTGLGRGLISTAGTVAGPVARSAGQAVQGPMLNAGTSIYGQLQPGSQGMEMAGTAASMYPGYMRNQMSSIASGARNAAGQVQRRYESLLPSQQVVTRLPPVPGTIGATIPRRTTGIEAASNLNVPYRTDGRRQSTNVEQAPMLTPEEIEAERLNRPFMQNPQMRSRMFLPGGVQGPLPQSAGQPFNARGQQTPGYLTSPDRVRAIADMYQLAGIQVPEQVAQIIRNDEIRQSQIQQQQTMSNSADRFATDLEQQRLARQGMFAGPTQQERDQFNADVERRIQENPAPINQFMNQEMAGRTRAGQQAMSDQLRSGYLSRPMQGGGFSMADREARLAMLQPPSAGARQGFGDSRAAMSSAINQELARQGVTPERLAEVGQLRNDTMMAQGGRFAASQLAPGTVIRGTDESGRPFTVVRGPGEPATSPEREQRLAAGRMVDRIAPQERNARMRAGRLAMMQNQMAAQRQAFEMATNPMVNPMLVANNPYAMTEIVRARAAQQEALANAPMREAELEGIRLQNEATRTRLSPDFQQQQRQAEAADRLAVLPPEQWNTPYGRFLQQQAMPEGTGTSPNAPPQTVSDASSVISSTAGNVSDILGFDPEASDPRQIFAEIDRRAGTTSPISGQDLDTILQYVSSRAKIDPEYYKGLGEDVGVSDPLMEAITTGKYTPGAYGQFVKDYGKAFQGSGQANRWSGRAF